MTGDPEVWTDADTWPVPSKVFKRGPLLIDAEINKRSLSLRAPKVRVGIRDRSIPIGRRALEVAIRKAWSARAANPPREKKEPDWRSIRDEAKGAAKAIRKTLRALDPKGKSARMFKLPISQTRLENPKFGTNVQRIARRAKRDALVLIAAKNILSGLAEDSERRRRNIVARLPAKSSDVEKHAFVFILYEAWIVLMGERPGSSPVAAQNPFLRFVEAAWQDWQGESAIWDRRKKGTPEKISFVRSLNVARAKVAKTSKKLPLAAEPNWLQLELKRANHKI